MVAIAAVCVLAPTSVGGANNYLLTNGTSMLPAIQPHSAVIIRKESAYHVGEVVAYHNPDLKTVVLHRIVRRDGSLYVFKGDNNSYADFYEPNQSDLIGKKVFYVPSAGRVLMALRTPWVGAPLLGLLVLWAFWDVKPKPKPDADADSADKFA